MVGIDFPGSPQSEIRLARRKHGRIQETGYPVVDSQNRSSLYLGAAGTQYRGGALLHNLLLFGRVCKALGMEVSPHRMIDAANALKWIDLTRKADFFHALRLLIVTRAADLPPFDEAFRLFWRRHSEDWTRLDLRSLGEERRQKRTRYLPSDESSGDQPVSEDGNTSLIPMPVYSPGEILRNKDFGEMTSEELACARLLVLRLARSIGERRTRRGKAGRSGIPELRAALRKNLRFGGEPVSLPRKVPKTKPRPIVLLCDISGSMERYTRILLHFAHALTNSLNHVETFVFGTRLTRITRPIRIRSIDKALQGVGSRVRDWAGGTQTGQSLHQFNYHWGRRVLGRGAVALLITDGWDRGDPNLLSLETARLRRSCWRLMWLNPLLGAPQYEPLTRGAQAILGHVDDFLSVRNLNSLEKLGRELSRVDWRRSHV